MNSVIYKGMVSAVLFLILLNDGFGQRDQVIVRLTDPAARGFLSFYNPKGTVKVTGYNGTTLIVTAVPRYNAGSDAKKNGSSLFSVSERSNTVTINRTESIGTIDFDLKIPMNFSLKINSQDNGTIEIINVNGDIEASNASGDVVLKGISGSAVVNTVNGSISASFIKTTANSPMMFTSLEGSIEIFLPEKTNAALRMRSQYGKIFSDFKIRSSQNQGQNKTYKLISDEGWTVGAINNGGPEYMINTYNGNIYLKKTGRSL